MKLSDYTRLGKISIKSRKKSTKNTVRGISFGLILLVPVVFLTFAVHFNLTPQMNAVRTLGTFTLQTKNFDDPSDSVPAEMSESNYIVKNAKISFETAENIAVSDLCEEVIVSNYISLGNSTYYSIDGSTDKALSQNSGGGNKYPSYGGQSDEIVTDIKIINLEKSGGKYIMDAEKQDLGGIKPILHGDGFDKTTKGKQQIIISEKFALTTDYKSNISALIGKKMSFIVKGQANNWEIRLDDDTNPDNDYDDSSYQQPIIANNYLMYEFEIAAIVSSDFFSLNSRSGEAHFWITSDSFYYTDSLGMQTKLLPSFRESYNDHGEYKQYYTVATYPTDDFLTEYEAIAKAEGIIFPMIPFVSLNKTDSSRYGNESVYVKAYSVYVAKDFAASAELSTLIAGYLNPLYPNISNSVNSMYESQIYSFIKPMYTAIQGVIIVLFVFGGIIFFTTLLNLYNSINYSVQARKNYMGVMRAIGAKQSSIPKMYLVEIVLMFLKTLIWVAIFSFGISFGIKALIDVLAKNAGGSIMGLTLSFDLIYYPAALGIMYGLSFLIALFFSLTACRSVSKKPLLQVLHNES